MKKVLFFIFFFSVFFVYKSVSASSVNAATVSGYLDNRLGTYPVTVTVNFLNSNGQFNLQTFYLAAGSVGGRQFVTSINDTAGSAPYSMTWQTSCNLGSGGTTLSGGSYVFADQDVHCTNINSTIRLSGTSCPTTTGVNNGSLSWDVIGVGLDEPNISTFVIYKSLGGNPDTDASPTTVPYSAGIYTYTATGSSTSNPNLYNLPTGSYNIKLKAIPNSPNSNNAYSVTGQFYCGASINPPSNLTSTVSCNSSYIRVDFTWSAANPGTFNNTVFISTASDFSTVTAAVVPTPATSNGVYIRSDTTSLVFSQTYYWQVRAVLSGTTYTSTSNTFATPANCNSKSPALALSNQYCIDSLGNSGVANTVYNVVVDTPGSGYFRPPRVGFYGGGGSGAFALAQTQLYGGVTGFIGIAGGSGYTSVPTVILVGGARQADMNNNTIYTTATATATVEASGQRRVTGINVTYVGQYYSSYALPSVYISGGGGTGATAHAVVTPTATPSNPVNGTVSSIVIDNPGSGYTSAPTVTIEQEAGPQVSSPGTAHAVLSDANPNSVQFYWAPATGGTTTSTKLQISTDASFGTGTVTEYTVSTLPTVTISGGAGSGATAAVQFMRNNSIGGIYVSNGGSGYSSGSPPTVTISGGGATTNATGTVWINNGQVAGIQLTNAGGSGYTAPPYVLRSYTFSPNTTYYWRINTQMDGVWYTSTTASLTGKTTCGGTLGQTGNTITVHSIAWCSGNASMYDLWWEDSGGDLTWNVRRQLPSDTSLQTMIISPTINNYWTDGTVGSLATGSTITYRIERTHDTTKFTDVVINSIYCFPPTAPDNLNIPSATLTCDNTTHNALVTFQFRDTASNELEHRLEVSTEPFTSDTTSNPTNTWGVKIIPSINQTTEVQAGFRTINFAWQDSANTNPTTTSNTTSLSGRLGGATATATAVVDTNGKVTGFTITSSGSGYSVLTTPTVTISAPASGTTATATAVVTGGAISNFIITNAGSGYSSATPPTVTISDPLAGNANPQVSAGGYNLVPLDGVTYYWRVKAAAGLSLASSYKYNDGTTGTYSGTLYPTGLSFTTPKCRNHYDLTAAFVPGSSKNSSNEKTQSFIAGTIATVDVIVTNLAGSDAVPAGTLVYLYPNNTYAVANCPGTAQTSPASGVVSATLGQLSPGGSQTITMSFNAGTQPKSYAAYAYVVPSCTFTGDPNNGTDSNWSNNVTPTAFAYSVGMPSFFQATGGDVATVGAISTGADGSCQNYFQSDYMLSAGSIGSNVKGRISGITLATATVTASGGSITGINVTSGGSGYPNTVKVLIYDVLGPGSGAVASATVSGGVIQNSVTISNGGSNYTNPAAIFCPESTGAYKINNYSKNQVITGGVYNYFANRFRAKAMQIDNGANAGCAIQNGTGTFNSASELYYCNTDVIISDPTSTTTITGTPVFFIDGNLTIRSNIVASGGNAVVFIVKGDIKIKNLINDINGIYIARKGFYDCEDVGYCVNQTALFKLTVTGAIYADGEESSVLKKNGIALGRYFGGVSANYTKPNDVINYDPKYLIVLNTILSSADVGWKETSP